MSRRFTERQRVDRVTNSAFAFVDRYTREPDTYYNKNLTSFLKPEGIDILPPYFETDDKNYKKAIYAAYYYFNKQEKAPAGSENLKRFKNVVERDVGRYLDGKIRQQLSKSNCAIDPATRRLINNILQSIAKSDSTEKYKINAQCLQELLKFTNDAQGEPSFEITEKEIARYPVLFRRFPELVNQYNFRFKNEYPAYFTPEYLQTDIVIANDAVQYDAATGVDARTNRFVLKQFAGEEKQLVYVSCNAKQIVLEVTTAEIDANLMAHITANDVNALRKALGNRVPRDRQLELSQRMYKKSQTGSTTTEFASAKLGALLEVPERMLRNYLLDNWLVGWLTSKNNDDTKINRMRAREHHIPGMKNRTPKRLRARARQRQVAENYSAEKFTQGISEERIHNLDLARRMFNSQTVGEGIVSCKPCCLIVDGRDDSKKRVTSDDYWLEQLNAKKYPGNAYIIKQGVTPPTVFYVDRSGSVPVITELSISAAMLMDLQYIAGRKKENFSNYFPGEHVQRLRERYGRDSLQHQATVREVQNMGQDLMSYLSLCTGHIPTQQLAEELEEKHQFNLACENLQRLLDESSGFGDDIRQFAEARAGADGKRFVELDEKGLPDPRDENTNYVYISPDNPGESEEYYFNGRWNTRKFRGVIVKEFASEDISQENYDLVLDWVIKGKVGECPVILDEQVCYSVAGKLNSKIWVSDSAGIIVDAARGSAGEEHLNNWIKEHGMEISRQGKFFGIRYVHSNPLLQGFADEEIDHADYDKVLEWAINGKPGKCPVALKPGICYTVEAKNTSKVWVSNDQEIIVDATDDGSTNPKLNAAIVQYGGAIANQGIICGIRYNPGAQVREERLKSYLNIPSQKEVRIQATAKTGEAQYLSLDKANINARLNDKIQRVLDKLRQIEDLPSSYITTSDSIVPYDTRQELVARLTDCLRNPQGSATWDYFRNEYTLRTYDSTTKRIEDFKKPENRCTFFYIKDAKQVVYIDANLNHHVSNLPALPKQYREHGGEYILNSQQVFEHITSKLPAESAFKVHTANEALEEIYADEVASTKSILKQVIQVALSVLLVLLMCSIPFVGQGFAMLGVSVATVWIGVVISSAISSLFIARDVSKHTFVSTARAELESLRDEMRSLTDASSEEVEKGDNRKPRPPG